jgi:hypothetical protein
MNALKLLETVKKRFKNVKNLMSRDGHGKRSKTDGIRVSIFLEDKKYPQKN